MTGVTQQVKQISVEAIVFRAQPCAGHEAFDAECQDCRDMPPVAVEDLGTIAHYHADPEQQASKSLLSKGRRIWRR